VFPARYELNSYIVFRKRLVPKKVKKDCRMIFCLETEVPQGQVPVPGLYLMYRC
jgi:hypothetical protein